MSLTQVHLHLPEIDHLPQIVELDRICLGGLWTIEAYQRELESPNTRLLVLSTPQDTSPEKIIGCGCYWAILEEAHITLLAIHPDYQGQGFGQLLLYALLKDAVERGLERATLEVRVSNEVAISLYKKFGFRVAGRRKKYYQQTGEDALILWRGNLHYPEFKQQLIEWERNIKLLKLQGVHCDRDRLAETHPTNLSFA